MIKLNFEIAVIPVKNTTRLTSSTNTTDGSIIQAYRLEVFSRLNNKA